MDPLDLIEGPPGGNFPEGWELIATGKPIRLKRETLLRNMAPGIGPDNDGPLPKVIIQGAGRYRAVFTVLVS